MVKMIDFAFLTHVEHGDHGLRVGVKDVIDVEGIVTTAGSRYVASHSPPALRDAACLAGLRSARAQIVGKTNLHELAFGTTGVNHAFGTPVNPLDRSRVPGGSSSGSAVAVALGLCEIALGTDTGGSIRIPSACCGTYGLKTTYGRIPTEGVWPLAPSLDTVGPMARDIDGLVTGMVLLEHGFREAPIAPERFGRLEVAALDSRVDLAVDSAVNAAELEVRPVDISPDEWAGAVDALNTILWAEAAESNLTLFDHWDELESGPHLRRGLDIAHDHPRLDHARRTAARWRERLTDAVLRYGPIICPTLEVFPPRVSELDSAEGSLARFTSPVNLAGLPAIAIPVPSTGPVVASLQMIGPHGGEEVLLAAARRLASKL